MKVKILLFAGMVLFSLAFVLAHENFTETKELIDSGVSCNKLTSSQLEEIGDYYMEQMHPGEAHETIHKMMGGEDSTFVGQMHINMAKSIYCGENTGMNGMMDMMGGGMMNYGSSAYVGYGNSMVILGWLIYTLVIILIIAAIYWLIKSANRKR